MPEKFWAVTLLAICFVHWIIFVVVLQFPDDHF